MLREKMCKGNCEVCEGNGGQCYRSYTLGSYIRIKFILKPLWLVRDVWYKISNTHWVQKGKTREKHIFCYKSHIERATIKTKE